MLSPFSLNSNPAGSLWYRMGPESAAGRGQAAETAASRCFGEITAAKHSPGRLGSTVGAPSKTVAAAERLVWQGVSGPGGTDGARRPKHPRGGSAPVIRPWLVQAGLSRRSLSGSFLAGRRGGLEARRDVGPKASESRHAPLTECAVRTAVDFFVTAGFVCGAGCSLWR